MQKCSKFPSQSEILDKKISLAIFTIVILFSGNSQVFGQLNEQIEISEYYEYEGFVSGFGEVIETDKLIFEIGKDATVHVKHIIIDGGWIPTEPKIIKMLPGKHSNLQLTDEDGDYMRPMGFIGETFEDAEYIIAGQKAFRSLDLVAEYDLENYLELNEYGLWGKHFKFPHDVEIFIDEDIELAFVNSRPIDVGDAKGVNCIGCDMRLEFFDEPVIVKKVITKTENKFEEFSNTGKEFVVEFLSDGDIADINFIKELNYLSFNANRENQLYMVKIPLELLLSPYHVYLTETGQDILRESDQIRKTEYKQTDAHANLSFRATSEGIISVVGATEMEHKKLLEQLERLTPKVKIESESKIEPNTLNDDSQIQDLYENWGETGSNKDENLDNTVIFVIIGIVAVIIIGIIIKIKKN